MQFDWSSNGALVTPRSQTGLQPDNSLAASSNKKKDNGCLPFAKILAHHRCALTAFLPPGNKSCFVLEMQAQGHVYKPLSPRLRGEDVRIHPRSLE